MSGDVKTADKTGDESTDSAEVEITREQADQLNEKGFSDEAIQAMDADALKEAMSAPKGDDTGVITEELVKKYGLPKSLAGQSIEKLADGFSKTRKAYTKRENELLGKLQQLQSTKTETQASSVGDLLDLEPDEQVKAIEKIIDQRVEQKLGPLKEIEQSQHQKAFFDTLTDMLPEGYEAEEVFSDWKTKRNLSNSEVSAYMQNPGLLIDNIVNFAQLDNVSKILEGKKKDKTAKDRKQSTEELLKMLKNADPKGDYKITKTKDKSIEWGTGSKATNDRLTRIYEKNAKKLGI